MIVVNDRATAGGVAKHTLPPEGTLERALALSTGLV
jgi:hypothetical protein